VTVLIASHGLTFLEIFPAAILLFEWIKLAHGFLNLH